MEHRFSIPSPVSDDESDDEIPELFLSQGSQETPTNNVKKPSHYIPGISPETKAEDVVAPLPEPTKSLIKAVSSPAVSVKLQPRKTGAPTKSISVSAITAHSKDVGTPVSSRAILVNPRQSKNPVLKYIENCRHSFSDKIVPDFVLSPTRCALFIRYV